MFGDDSNSDVDDIVMMVTDLRCWWRNHYVDNFFSYVEYFLNVFNWSPPSWIGHQHLKLVTNTLGLHYPSLTSSQPASGSGLWTTGLVRSSEFPYHQTLVKPASFGHQFCEKLIWKTACSRKGYFYQVEVDTIYGSPVTRLKITKLSSWISFMFHHVYSCFITTLIWKKFDLLEV